MAVLLGFAVLARELHLELIFDDRTVHSSVDGHPVDYHDGIAGYPEQIEAFVRAVEMQDRSLIRCSYGDGPGTLAATRAANRSLQNGKPEPIANQP